MDSLIPMQDLSMQILFEGMANAADNVYIFVSDLTRDVSVWSDNAVSYFGFPQGYEDHTLEVWLQHVHPDDRAGYTADLDALFSGKESQHIYQYRAANAQGQYVWLECMGSIAQDDRKEGHRFFVGTITRLDITAKFDPITHCLNLSEFYQTVFSAPKTLVLLGLDRFRKVINRMGFSESNRILNGLGDILQQCAGVDNVYRMTGDEFLLVLPFQDKADTEALFRTLLTYFSNARPMEYDNIHLGFSGGGTYYDPARENKEQVIQQLEHSLEYAKQQGGNTFTFYSSLIEEKHMRTSRIQEALTHAIRHDFEGFFLVYQPIVQSETHQLDGLEALLRFETQELGVLSPVEFIPLLENSREINAVGLWVAEQVIRQAARWNAVRPGLKLGFNASLLQFQTMDLVDSVIRWLEEYQLDPDQLVIELTESVKTENLSQLRTALERLSEKGVWVMLDDFGMEASSFSLVQELPVQGIKVDHSFVRTMIGSDSPRRDNANIAIISSITYLADQLGLRVIVEGVENQAIDQLLCSMGSKFLQGYYYSRPVTPQEIERSWLQPTQPPEAR